MIDKISLAGDITNAGSFLSFVLKLFIFILQVLLNYL